MKKFIEKIRDEFIVRRYEYYDKKYQKKQLKQYPNWNDETWMGSFEILYGSGNTNIHNMNDFGVYYDHETELYHIEVEGFLLFKTRKEEVEYLEECLDHFTKFMDNNGYNKNYKPIWFAFCVDKGIFSDEDVEVLYAKFKMFVEGWRSINKDNMNEVLYNDKSGYKDNKILDIFG